MEFLIVTMLSSHTVIILMQEAARPVPIIPLLVLGIIAGLFSLGIVITLSVEGSTGFGGTYGSSNACNAYLITKFETKRAIGLQLRYIEAIVITLCLIIETIANIRTLHEIRIIQEQKSNQIYEYSQGELNLKYVCNSMAIMGLISIFGFYLSIIIQEGSCFKTYYVEWIILLVLSAIALLLTIICWVILVNYSSNRKKDKQNISKENIEMQEIRQRQADIKNVFEMEGSELYKTLRRENKDSAEPLLVFNDPIPLFNKPIRKTSSRQPVINSFQQPVFNQRESDYVPIIAERKKSSSPKKGLLPPMAKSKVSAMIQQKKNKFREINPLKKSVAKHKIQQEQDQQVINHENMMKKLPKSYMEYIMESKRPKRNPPNIDLILQNYNNEQNARILAQLALEQKPFLKRYRKDQQATQEKPAENEQIEFIDEQLLTGIVQKAEENVAHPQEERSNEAELFFHKLRSDKNSKKKRKMLFQQDVMDAKQLEENQSKQLVINKIRQAKNNKLKMANKTDFLNEPLRSPRKKHINTKQDIMLSFLKSKYLAPQQQQDNRQEE